MIDSEKVDKFYSFLQNKRYSKKNPDNILIISPNHFNTNSQTAQTICNKETTLFKQEQLWLTPLPNIDCKEEIFYPLGWIYTTKEHGIAEHFIWINKYFSSTKTIYPLILPSHKLSATKQTLLPIQKLKGNTLIIASVDFSHYLPEVIAYKNDQESIKILQKGNWTQQEVKELNVDCPSCLYLINEIARNKQSAKLYWRDSSSTILWKDLQSENTSRVFMYYENNER